MQIIKSQNEAPAKYKNIFFKIRMISLNIVLDLSYLYEIISLLTYYFEILFIGSLVIRRPKVESVLFDQTEASTLQASSEAYRSLN